MAPHAGATHRLLVARLPPGTVLLQGGVGMRGELSTQGVIVSGADRGRSAGDGAGIDAAGLPALVEVAVDGGQRHIEDAGHLSLARASIDRRDNFGSEVGGVCSHGPSSHLTQPLRKPL